MLRLAFFAKKRLLAPLGDKRARAEGKPVQAGAPVLRLLVVAMQAAAALSAFTRVPGLMHAQLTEAELVEQGGASLFVHRCLEGER